MEKEKKVRKLRKKRAEVKPVLTSNWKYEVYEIIGNNARFSFVQQFNDLEAAEFHITEMPKDLNTPRKFEIKLVYVC